MTWLAPLDIGLVMGLVLSGAVLALGVAFRLFRFPDLTVEGSLPLGAACYAVAVRSELPVGTAVLCAVLAGACLGGLTAFLHVRLHLNKFLAGILVVAIAYSVTLRVMGGSNIGLLQAPSAFDAVSGLDARFSGSFHVGTLALLGAWNLGLALLAIAGLRTRAGIRMRAAGSNPIYAASLGIAVPTAIVLGLAFTNGVAASAGAILAMHQGFADVGMGVGTLVLALAALTIGERVVPERRVSYPVFVIVACVAGSVIYQVIVAYAVRMGLSPTDLKLATAVLVLLVVGLRISRYETLTEKEFA